MPWHLLHQWVVIERAYKVRNAWRHESNKFNVFKDVDFHADQRRHHRQLEHHSLNMAGREAQPRVASGTHSHDHRRRSQTQQRHYGTSIFRSSDIFYENVVLRCNIIFCSLNSFSRQGSWEWDQTEGQRHWWNAEQCESSRNESRGRTDRLARSSCSRGRFYI